MPWRGRGSGAWRPAITAARPQDVSLANVNICPAAWRGQALDSAREAGQRKLLDSSTVASSIREAKDPPRDSSSWAVRRELTGEDDYHLSSGAENAPDLGMSRGLEDERRREGGHDHISRTIRDWQGTRIRLNEPGTARTGSSASLSQHPSRSVDADPTASLLLALGGELARPAAELDDCRAGRHEPQGKSLPLRPLAGEDERRETVVNWRSSAVERRKGTVQEPSAWRLAKCLVITTQGTQHPANEQGYRGSPDHI